MVIDWGAFARAVHVLAVVVWIGGVWLVTTVLLPLMRGKPAERWLEEFEAIEHRFAPQARIAVVLTMLSGVSMLFHYDFWDRFARIKFWWMHLMVAVWLLFATLLFVLEPMVLRRVLHRSDAASSASSLKLMLRLHRGMLALSLLAIFAAVGGSHGLF